MLRHLHVRNLAVVEEASVDFATGLCVLTGETGAGKSIVVDCLALLGGARASSDQIRTGAEVLSVTGVFQPRAGGWRALLEEHGVHDDDQDELVVRREVTRSGRNRVFINDQPATLRLLADVARFLVRLHGQRDELELVAPELQRQWLDRAGGSVVSELVERCTAAFTEWREAYDRHQSLYGDDRLRQERLDLLRYQAQELSAAGLVAGEEIELKGQRELLRNAEQIARAAAEAIAVLIDDDSSAAAQLARARFAIRPLQEWSPEIAAALGDLDELRIRIEDIGSMLRSRFGDIEADPARLDEIESRLAVLERLLRKYAVVGNSQLSTAELLEQLARLEQEVADLEASDERLAELETRVAAKLRDFQKAATELSRVRSLAAERLATEMSRELAELAMPHARFQARLERRGREDSPLRIDGRGVEMHAHGIDQVVFEFSPNPGEDLRPLAKVASGGELARVYLALQVAARGDGSADPSTLVFDEVDSGVGGAEAAVIGAKLRRLSRGGQILAVTHLPQVAACGDHHYGVKKEVRDGRTRVLVARLGEEARVEEVARMLGGAEITALSRSHARELLVVAGEESTGSPARSTAVAAERRRRAPSVSGG